MTTEDNLTANKNRKEFIHLHVHTEYSLLDGAAKIKNLVAAVKKQGASAVAMTDHGNMFGTVKFYNACKEAEIKPIIGQEFYVANDLHNKKSSKNADSEDDTSNPKYHLVLLAKNTNGYKNLAKLSSIGYVDGFYGKPRIDLNVLEKYSTDLICMTACLGGALPSLLLSKTSADPYGDALAYAKRMKAMFAEGDFYIELQDHGLPEQKQTNPLLVKIARELKVKCVATNDAHYINKSDAEMHDILLCIQTASDYDDPKRMRFSNDEFYLKTYDEMYELFKWCPEAITTTLEIAEKCNFAFPKKKDTIPVFENEEGLSPADYLRKICYEGLHDRYGETLPQEYIDRAEHELGIIIRMNFPSYFLIVWDFIRYAKSEGIPVGAGRGSGVGSIVAYAIRITDVDPMKYGLIFERFLNPDRVSMPDFDVDFCGERRDEVISYVRRIYKPDHVAQIITFGTMKSKQAIKDVARVFKLPFAEVNELLKNVKIADKKIKIANLIDEKDPSRVKELVEMYRSNPTYKKVLDIAIQIEDMPRNRGKHAAGVIICSDPLIDTIPLAKNGDDVTTQFDMTECESLGLLKMDFLALKTLTDVQMCKDFVKGLHGKDIDFDKLGYEDPNVYGLIASGDTETVFQLESSGMKDFMKKLKPNLLEEIIAGISIYRPGPIDMMPFYIKNKLDNSLITYKVPALEPILKETYGITVYQEQAMKITQAVAGYTMAAADNFRKFISKKQGDEKEKIESEKFINGCVKNGYDEKFATELWAELKAFGSYAFNKSHAAAYAVLSYQTAYMKCYYPVEYMCSVINNRLGNADDTTKYLRLIKQMNIELLQPDINNSYALFRPENGKIRYGLACIKNVGRQAIDEVIRLRDEDGKFKDFSDFARRVPSTLLNRRMIENLIMGGAFDCFNHTRRTLLENYATILDLESANADLINGGQMFFDFMVEEEYSYKEIPETKKERLAYEREVAGRYITGHPLDGHEEDFEQFSFNLGMLKKEDAAGFEDDVEAAAEPKETVYAIESGREVRLGGIISNIQIKISKNKKRWVLANFEDMHDSIEITMFQATLDRYAQYLVEDNLVIIRGRVSYSEGSAAKIDVREISPLMLSGHDTVYTFDRRKLCIRLEEDDWDTFERVERILKAHHGENEIIFQIGGKAFRVGYTTGDLDKITDSIIGLVGSANVKITD